MRAGQATCSPAPQQRIQHAAHAYGMDSRRQTYDVVWHAGSQYCCHIRVFLPVAAAAA